MDSGQHAEGSGSSLLRTFVTIVVMVAFIFGLSWLLRTFVFQPYEIPSGSMEQTIMTGDMVFSEKISYHLRDPQPGDIVTFQDPEIPGRILIKRVIATGGQTVNINDQDGLVYVDGVPLSEPYTGGKPSYSLSNSVANVTFPYTVPLDSLWVMGDNRTNSQDSRYFGAIDASTVTGRGALIYWPLNNFGLLQ